MPLAQVPVGPEEVVVLVDAEEMEAVDGVSVGV